MWQAWNLLAVSTVGAAGDAAESAADRISRSGDGFAQSTQVEWERRY